MEWACIITAFYYSIAWQKLQEKAFSLLTGDKNRVILKAVVHQIVLRSFS
jgi:hypothetical protein